MRARGSRTGRCKLCAYPDRARIERALAAGASLRATAKRYKTPYHALRRHWVNHVNAEARAAYVAGCGTSKDQLEELITDTSLSVLDHLRIIRARLYSGFDAASETGDRVNLDRLAGRLHENLALAAKLTGELQRGPLLAVQNSVLINPDYTRAIACLVAAVSSVFGGARGSGPGAANIGCSAVATRLVRGRG